MILRIVADDHNTVPIACGLGAEHFEKDPKALAIETAALPLINEFAIVQAYCSEIADALACGVMV
jgi:hypothetical protein